MKLLIDAQSIQSTSAMRGIGRYSLCLTQALVATAQAHGSAVEVMLAAGGEPNRLMRARRAIESFLPAKRIHVFDAPWAWAPPQDRRRRPVAEAAYAAAVAALRPDALLVTSVFEGDLETVLSVGASRDDPPAAAILYDLIPALEPKTYLLGPGADVYWRRFEDMRRCRSLLAISEHSARQATTLMGDASPPVSPIWGGAYPSGRFPAFEQQVDEHADLTLPARFVLTVGGDHARKNLDRLVAAWGTVPPALRRETPLVVACRLNAGTLRRLRGVAARSGVSPEELVFPGGVAELTLRDLYRRAHAFVFPSLEEGLGMPPLESMAAGCPTVMARGSSLSELSSEPSSFFDGTSVPSMAKALELVITDQTTRDTLERAATVTADRFTWERSASLAWDTLAVINSASVSSPPTVPDVVLYSDTRGLMQLPEAPAPVLLDTGLHPSSSAPAPAPASADPPRTSRSPRTELTGATALIIPNETRHTEVLAAGVLDQPLLESSTELHTAVQHDFYAAYAARLPAGATALADTIARAVSRTPRWMLQRPRPVWLALTRDPEPVLVQLLKSADADVLIVRPDGLGLGEFADGVLVPAGEVAALARDLHRIRRRGAVIIVVQDRSEVVTVPDWCTSVTLPASPSSAEAGALVEQISLLIPRTTGWPWRD